MSGVDPSDATFYSNRAAVLAKLHRPAECVEDCRRATELKPDYTRAWARMGAAQLLLGQFDDAADSFRSMLWWSVVQA